MTIVKLSVPDVRSYVVAELDIEATLDGVADPAVRARIQAITPAKCLLFLNHHDPSLDTAHACTYTVDLIGPGFRPADPSKGLTPDMCAPIFPTAAGPTHRAPLHTVPAFPFRNCAHWFGTDMSLNVRIGVGSGGGGSKPRDGATARAHAPYELPYDQYLLLENMYDEDIRRGEDALFGTGAPSAAADVRSVQSRASRVSQRPSFDGESLFSDGEGGARLPVLRAWTDLPAHLAPGAVPDPLVFAEQYRALTRMLQGDVAAASGAGAPPWWSTDSSGSGEHSGSSGASSMTAPAPPRGGHPKSKNLPSKALRAVRSFFSLQSHSQ